MRGLARLMVLCLIVGVVGAAVPAGATHNATDEHSANMELVFNYPSPQTATAVDSDLAFWGNQMFAANYDGLRMFDISNPTSPVLLADQVCRGPQNDVSVWEDLIIQSVDRPQVGPGCTQDTPTPPAAQQQPGSVNTATSFEGIRIFSRTAILNAALTAPDRRVTVQPLRAVPTDCGSHTHTLVPDLDFVDPTTRTTRPRLLAYVSSYPLGVGALSDGVKADGTECREPHNKISIVEIFPDAPAQARVLREWALPGGTEPTHRTTTFGGVERMQEFTGCHDIAVYLAINLAASACWREGQFWDITDPANPDFLDRIRNDRVSDLFHSATFTWDGKVVAFEDEAGGGGDNRCARPADDEGRMWWYEVKSGRLLGSFKIPRPQGKQTCTAHNYNVVPLRNRYILVSAWYQGGTSVIDFTNPNAAREIGYYDVGELLQRQTTTAVPSSSDVWSSYWYNGPIYANDINRGLDVFTIDNAAITNAPDLPFLNPQTQHELLEGAVGCDVFGTDGHDVLQGTSNADVLCGFGGNDEIVGRGGDDILLGGAGADVLRGGGGDDVLRGQKGSDLLLGGPGSDTCVGGAGRDFRRRC